MGNTNPKILNLDEMELPESEITIISQGTSHKMRTLTVEMFIAQQKRATEQQKLVEEKATVEDQDMGDVVSLIRDSILEFFPTLPVNELETAKLFSIFAWLNDLTAQINDASAPAEASAEGKVEAATEAPAS